MGQPGRLLPQMQRLEARQARTETDRETTTAVQSADADMTPGFLEIAPPDPPPGFRETISGNGMVKPKRDT
jgi:hypothetical protein